MRPVEPRTPVLLPPVRHDEDHVLLTTLEPCCMCLGAAVQAILTRLQFAGRDPNGGASRLPVDTPQARRRPLAVTGPRAGWAGSPNCCTCAGCWTSVPPSRCCASSDGVLPDVWRAPVDPAAGGLFGRLTARSAGVEEAMASTRGPFPRDGG